MRSIWAIVAALVISSAASSAEADVEKAWQAAKANLPDTIPAIGAVDVAAGVKLPAFATFLALLRQEERDVREGLDQIKSACNLDVTQAVDGFVVAGDPAGRDDDITIFVQLKVDRPQASSCFQAVLQAAEPRKQVAIKQAGMFTEVSVGGDTAYFAWVDKQVVAFNVDPGNKQRLERSLGKQGLAKAPVGVLLGKLDPKAVAFGAIKATGKQLDRNLPLTAAYGNITLAGATASALVVGTALDANAAASLAGELSRELNREIARPRNPELLKKVLKAIAVKATGTEVTLKGTASTTDLVEALRATLAPAKREVAVPAPAP